MALPLYRLQFRCGGHRNRNLGFDRLVGLRVGRGEVLADPLLDSRPRVIERDKLRDLLLGERHERLRGDADVLRAGFGTDREDARRSGGDYRQVLLSGDCRFGRGGIAPQREGGSASETMAPDGPDCDG
jgi:hypothetical protein